MPDGHEGPPLHRDRKGQGRGEFFDEHRIYEILNRAGLRVPRHEWLEEARAPTVFGADEEVVVKGQAEGLWHKTEAGAVRFVQGCQVAATVAELQPRLSAWRGALVCERVEIARSSLPSEGFVSLAHRQGLWVAVVGFGGLAVEALGVLVPPLIWPLELMTGDEAMAELEHHLLGQVWLGRVRGTKPLTTHDELGRLVAGIWRLREVAQAEGLALVEVNPLVVDGSGRIVALDGVGSGGLVEASPRARALGPLLSPRRVALLGVPSGEGPAASSPRT